MIDPVRNGLAHVDTDVGDLVQLLTDVRLDFLLGTTLPQGHVDFAVMDPFGMLIQFRPPRAAARRNHFLHFQEK